jgi:protein-S-isoprenylcysteine O-methyltransferase Ste14
MSFVPALELGVWNAWILVIPLIVIFIFGSRILGKRGSGDYSGHTKRERMFSSITSLIQMGSIAYSIFLPLQLDTDWFSVGLVIYGIGIIIEILVLLAFATTPENKPVTKGVFNVSRNPGYLGELLIYAGIGTACLSWIFLIVATIAIILEHQIVLGEERICLNQYGDDYQQYMKRTPRWIGFPKSKNEELT